MLSKGSLWSHLKKLCCDYLALVQNEDSTDAEFDTVIDRAAETIAAQHEEELARARSEQTELLPCGHPASVVEDDGCAMCNLEARGAVMGQALGFVSNAIGQAWKADRELRDRGGVLEEQFAQLIDALGTCSERAEQALSGAPKVWRMQGRTSLHYDIEVMAEGAPEEFRQLLISRSMFAPWDVMVCLPKAGQPTESEQGEEEREDG